MVPSVLTVATFSSDVLYVIGSAANCSGFSKGSSVRVFPVVMEIDSSTPSMEVTLGMTLTRIFSEYSRALMVSTASPGTPAFSPPVSSVLSTAVLSVSKVTGSSLNQSGTTVYSGESSSPIYTSAPSSSPDTSISSTSLGIRAYAITAADIRSPTMIAAVFLRLSIAGFFPAKYAPAATEDPSESASRSLSISPASVYLSAGL